MRGADEHGLTARAPSRSGSKPQSSEPELEIATPWTISAGDMQTISVQQSVAMIPDGASLMIGGFMAVGTPERVIDEIVRQRKRDLTVIANDTATPGHGIGKLVDREAGAQGRS